MICIGLNESNRLLNIVELLLFLIHMSFLFDDFSTYSDRVVLLPSMRAEPRVSRSWNIFLSCEKI